jgi:hypothetical protein
MFSAGLPLCPASMRRGCFSSEILRRLGVQRKRPDPSVPDLHHSFTGRGRALALAAPLPRTPVPTPVGPHDVRRRDVLVA